MLVPLLPPSESWLAAPTYSTPDLDTPLTVKVTAETFLEMRGLVTVHSPDWLVVHHPVPKYPWDQLPLG